MPQVLSGQQAVIVFEEETSASLTQPWVVKIVGEEKEVARFGTYMQAFRHISWKGHELLDEQEIAQAELEQFLEEQAEVVAPTTDAITEEFADIARQERAKKVEIVEKHGDKFVVLSNENYYVVNPSHPNRKQRCECGDCHFRGSKCKHQLAVEAFNATRSTPINNLPTVGSAYPVGNLLLKCIESGGKEYASVYDVIDGSLSMGEVQMGWDSFWSHNTSIKNFSTPYEAIANLIENLFCLI